MRKIVIAAAATVGVLALSACQGGEAPAPEATTPAAEAAPMADASPAADAAASPAADASAADAAAGDATAAE